MFSAFQLERTCTRYSQQTVVRRAWKVGFHAIRVERRSMALRKENCVHYLLGLSISSIAARSFCLAFLLIWDPRQTLTRLVSCFVEYSCSKKEIKFSTEIDQRKGGCSGLSGQLLSTANQWKVQLRPERQRIHWAVIIGNEGTIVYIWTGRTRNSLMWQIIWRAYAFC